MKAAEVLARQFLTADTTGNVDAALPLFGRQADGSSRTCVIGGDAWAVVRTASLGRERMSGDTALVELNYSVLGVATVGDPNHASPKDVGFSPGVRIESVLLRVARDATGKLAIVCDPDHPPNHWGLALWQTLVPRLDSASVSAWESVATLR